MSLSPPPARTITIRNWWVWFRQQWNWKHFCILFKTAQEKLQSWIAEILFKLCLHDFGFVKWRSIRALIFRFTGISTVLGIYLFCLFIWFWVFLKKGLAGQVKALWEKHVNCVSPWYECLIYEGIIKWMHFLNFVAANTLNILKIHMLSREPTHQALCAGQYFCSSVKFQNQDRRALDVAASISHVFFPTRKL